MEFKIHSIKSSLEYGKVIVLGETAEVSPNFILRKRNNGRDFEFISEIKLEEVERVDSNFTITVNLQSILEEKNYDDQTIWSLVMVTDKKEYTATASEKCENNTDYFSDERYIFQVKPYITKENSIAFFVKKHDANFYAQNLKYENGILNAKIKLEGKNENLLLNKSISIKIRKRSQTNFPFHEETIEIDSIERLKDSSIEIVCNISETIYLEPCDLEVVWDFYIFVYDDYNNESIYPIQLRDSNNKFSYYSLKTNVFYRIKPYITGDKRLAIYISRVQNSVIATKIVDESETIIIDIDPKIKEICDNWELIIKRKMKVANRYEYYDIALLSNVESYDNISITIDKDNLLSNYTLRENESWDFFVRVRNKEMQHVDLFIDVPSGIKKEFKYFNLTDNNHRLKSKLLVDDSSKLSLYIVDKNEVKENSVKVAVLGTCFSRNAFNSSDYFNPDYKKMFNCVFTQFHSSLISLVSEKVNFDLNVLNDISENDLEFVKVDFEKTFFSKLRQANADYIIIDLYPDACKSVLELGDNQYVTGSYMIERSKAIKKLPITNIIDHSRNDEYFELWKNAANIFVSELKRIIPEERIILTRGRFTPVYYDENRDIKYFRDLELIKRNNYFWDRLDNYFIHIMPNIKTIDLTDTNYIGDTNYPFGRSFSHYQSEYYKEYLNRLTKLIFQDNLI